MAQLMSPDGELIKPGSSLSDSEMVEIELSSSVNPIFTGQEGGAEATIGAEEENTPLGGGGHESEALDGNSGRVEEDVGKWSRLRRKFDLYFFHPSVRGYLYQFTCFTKCTKI